MITRTVAHTCPDAAPSGHWMVRDGSVWLCEHCKTTRPFGGGMPDLTDVPCVPRQWGDGL